MLEVLSKFIILRGQVALGGPARPLCIGGLGAAWQACSMEHWWLCHSEPLSAPWQGVVVGRAGDVIGACRSRGSPWSTGPEPRGRSLPDRLRRPENPIWFAECVVCGERAHSFHRNLQQAVAEEWVPLAWASESWS